MAPNHRVLVNYSPLAERVTEAPRTVFKLRKRANWARGVESGMGLSYGGARKMATLAAGHYRHRLLASLSQTKPRYGTARATCVMVTCGGSLKRKGGKEVNQRSA